MERSRDSGLEKFLRERYFTVLLEHAFLGVEKGVKDYLDQIGLGWREFQAINVLFCLNQPTSQQQLAAAIGLNKALMVGVVDKLEAAKIVERRTNPRDRRENLVELSKLGRTKAQRVLDLVTKIEVLGPLGTLSGDERDQLRALLEKVLAGSRSGYRDEEADRLVADLFL